MTIELIKRINSTTDYQACDGVNLYNCNNKQIEILNILTGDKSIIDSNSGFKTYGTYDGKSEPYAFNEKILFANTDGYLFTIKYIINIHHKEIHKHSGNLTEYQYFPDRRNNDHMYAVLRDGNSFRIKGILDGQSVGEPEYNLDDILPKKLSKGAIRIRPSIGYERHIVIRTDSCICLFDASNNRNTKTIITNKNAEFMTPKDSDWLLIKGDKSYILVNMMSGISGIEHYITDINYYGYVRHIIYDDKHVYGLTYYNDKSQCMFVFDMMTGAIVSTIKEDLFGKQTSQYTHNYMNGLIVHNCVLKIS